MLSLNIYPKKHVIPVLRYIMKDWYLKKYPVIFKRINRYKMTAHVVDQQQVFLPFAPIQTLTMNLKKSKGIMYYET